MARNIVIYPSANITVRHSGGNYSTVADARNNYDTTAISHSLSNTSTTSVRSVFRCEPRSSEAPTGSKIRIRRITGGEVYTRLSSTNASSQTASLAVGASIGGTRFVNASPILQLSRNDSNFSTTQLTVSNLTGSSQIFETIADANIQVSLTSTGSYVSESKNSYSAALRISAVNLDLEYDRVYECKAVVQGQGIASATPSSNNPQNVVEGETCTFTAVPEPGCRVKGWYDNAEFSGTPLSTSASFVYTPNKHTTLYPKGEVSNKIYIFSEIGESDKFTYQLAGVVDSHAFVGETVTLTVQITDELYRFAGIYEADSEGHKLSNNLSSLPVYSFTMPSRDVYLFIDLGKEVKIYVTCYDCSLVGETSPIQSAVGKTETLSFVPNSGSVWSGIYLDAKCKNRLTQEQTYSFMVEDNNDLYLYAKAVPNQQIYVKGQSEWETYSEVYRKENGIWVKKEDFTGIFNTGSKYRRITL